MCMYIYIYTEREREVFYTCWTAIVVSHISMAKSSHDSCSLRGLTEFSIPAAPQPTLRSPPLKSVSSHRRVPISEDPELTW